MPFLLDILLSIILLLGAFFILVGSIGLIRLPDLFMRLHAPTKASTLGLGSCLLAAMLYSAVREQLNLAAVLLTLFAFITAPVSANLLAQAAIHLRLRSRSGDVPEAIDRPLPWQRRKSKNKSES